MNRPAWGAADVFAGSPSIGMGFVDEELSAQAATTAMAHRAAKRRMDILGLQFWWNRGESTIRPAGPQSKVLDRLALFFARSTRRRARLPVTPTRSPLPVVLGFADAKPVHPVDGVGGGRDTRRGCPARRRPLRLAAVGRRRIRVFPFRRR